MFVAPEVDALAYHESARRIAAGDWGGGAAALRMSPAWHYLLALVYRVLGDGPWPVRVVQLGFGLAAVGFTWAAGRHLLGRWGAWLPALAVAAYGPLVFYESTRLATPAAVAAHAALLWWVVRAFGASRGPGKGDWLVAGLLWGACTVLRPNAATLGLALLPAAAGLLGGERPGARPARRAVAVALLLAGAALAVAPITARNWLATGEAVLLTAHGGLNFYIGNGPGATGTFRVPAGVRAHGIRDSFEGFHAEAERRAGRPLSPAQADRFWYRATWEAVRSRPLAWARLALRKLRLFWNGYELANVYHYGFYRELNPVLGGPLLQPAWLLPLAFAGTLLGLVRGPAWRLVSLLNLSVCLGLVLVFVLGRYRLPALPGEALAAGLALAWAARGLAARRWRSLLPVAVATGAGALLARPVAVDPHLEREYHKLGTSWQAQGRLERAEAAYRRALAIDPALLPAHRDLAIALQAGGRYRRAARRWRRLEALAAARGDAGLARLAAAQRRVLRRMGYGDP